MAQPPLLARRGNVIFVGPSIQNQRSPTKMVSDLIVIAMLGDGDRDLSQFAVQNWQKEFETFRDIDESRGPNRRRHGQPQAQDSEYPPRRLASRREVERRTVPLPHKTTIRCP